MRSKPVLTLDDVRPIMAAAIDEASRRHLEVTVAIVDDAGVPLLIERLDGARLHTPDAAIAKARTAAITRTPTATLQQQLRADPSMLAFPDRLPVAGGVPIVVEGQVVGAVGSSGAASDEDEAVCRAALAGVRAQGSAGVAPDATGNAVPSPETAPNPRA